MFKKDILLLSNNSNYLKKNINAKINKEQLLAFQMSGYTIGDKTIWNKIFNLNPCSILYFKNKNNYNVRQYFNYFPWLKNNKKKEILKLELINELKNLY